MLLAVDAGNTNITFGVFSGDRDDGLLSHWRLPTQKEMTADSLAALFMTLFSLKGYNLKDIRAVSICCVVPPLLPVLVGFTAEYLGCEAFVVTGKTKTGISILYDNPAEVGADRVVNAVAAYSTYGGPCIVVDFGTATTFDVISAQGEYLGGAIAPGISISLSALFEKTAMLPRIELLTPSRVIGKNTVESMQSGAVFGFAGQVDGIVNRMKQELGPDVKVVATGGLAKAIARACETITRADEFLTLKGLNQIYTLNNP